MVRAMSDIVLLEEWRHMNVEEQDQPSVGQRSQMSDVEASGRNWSEGKDVMSTVAI